jgi:hypothetical protein
MEESILDQIGDSLVAEVANPKAATEFVVEIALELIAVERTY